MKLLKWIVIGLSTCFSLSNAYSQSNPASKSPEQKTFNLSPDNISALQNSVNLISGQVSFPMGIAALASRGGLSPSISFQYTTSGVQKAVRTNNQDSPTSFLGLGWSMEVPRIVVDNKQTGTRHDDNFYLIEGGASNPLICVSHVDTLSKYAAKNFSPWIIEYYPMKEKWIIKKEDGSKYTYGDKNSGRNTVQWMVKWGNWIGNSAQPANQQQTGYIWNLSEAENMWGDKIVYGYDNVEENVAIDDNTITTEKKHTKASYLKTITDPIGQSIVLNYSEKLNDAIEKQGEWKDPHNEKQEPDAYQEKYETRYLNSLDVKTLNGALLYSVDISYNVDTIGYDKRYLTKIQKRFPNNETQPAMQFEYFTSGESIGYLKKVLNSLGAHVDYYYESQTISDSDRQTNISAPTGYGQPVVYMQDEYSVITWRKLKSDNSIDPAPQPIKIYGYF